MAARKKAPARKKAAPRKPARTARRTSPARRPAPRKPKPIPDGAHTVIANLVHADCAAAIALYKRALGATEIMRMPSPDGKAIWHAELKVGNSVVYLNDAMPGMGPPAPSPERPAPVSFWIWSKDCDAACATAAAAGFTVKNPPQDMFWGDRCADLHDPYGYRWAFATHVKDMTEAEMAAGGKAFAEAFAKQQGG
jgi:uncharacterized glyoxalase superfamily protein PhnB